MRSPCEDRPPQTLVTVYETSLSPAMIPITPVAEEYGHTVRDPLYSVTKSQAGSTRIVSPFPLESIMKNSLMFSAVLILSLAACGPATQNQSDSGPAPQPIDSGTPASVDAGQPPGTPDSGQPTTTDDPQLPDTTSAATIDAWLAKGYYKTWKCEAEVQPRGSPHGNNRICSNEALSKTTGDKYPVGAVGLKELYNGGKINGYALEIKKLNEQGAEQWFWYEKIGTSVVANGFSAGICSGCHTKAPKDFVYTQIE
jgi:hypothetical protein